MVLIDAGPLVALVDKADETHKKALSTFRSFKKPPLTTWACLAEAFHLIGVRRGWKGQKTLLGLLTRRAVLIHSQNEDEVHRISELMEQYHDTPMDFADASLVTLAELKGLTTIFTKDSDFYVFQIHGKDSFEVILLDAL